MQTMNMDKMKLPCNEKVSCCFICLHTGTLVKKLTSNMLHESGWKISFLCTKISANRLAF